MVYFISTVRYVVEGVVEYFGCWFGLINSLCGQANICLSAILFYTKLTHGQILYCPAIWLRRKRHRCDRLCDCVLNFVN